MDFAADYEGLPPIYQDLDVLSLLKDKENHKSTQAAAITPTTYGPRKSKNGKTNKGSWVGKSIRIPRSNRGKGKKGERGFWVCQEKGSGSRSGCFVM
jgi:hypothetical protein